MAGLSFPRRGEIYLVSFDPTVGSEIRKTRPALVLQNDIANEYSPITIVAAITSKIETKVRPTSVLVGGENTGLNITSVILLNQVRSIDKSRLIKLLGRVDEQTLKRVCRSIMVSFGLIEL